MSLPFFSSDAVRIKICGLTRPQDALDAIEVGADALGFNFWRQSKRGLIFDQVKSWITDLPRHVARVAVVVNADTALLEQLHTSQLFDAIQFHGDETPHQCEAFPWTHWIRAMAIRTQDDLAIAHAYQTPWILMDAPVPLGAYGGTGTLANWEMIRTFSTNHSNKKLILAGGLTAKNVASAIQAVHPFAVDVASGVESSPGIKDRRKMQAFVASVRQAASKA